MQLANKWQKMVKNGRLWVINIQDFSSKIKKKWRQKICNLYCSFWFNWDLKMFRTSKWPSAPQFCKIFYCRWQKKWQERVIKLQIYEVVSFKHNQSIESWIVKTQLNKSKDSSSEFKLYHAQLKKFSCFPSIIQWFRNIYGKSLDILKR